MFSQLSNNDYWRKIFPRNVIRKKKPSPKHSLAWKHEHISILIHITFIFVCRCVGDKFNDMASSFKNTYYPASKSRKHKTTNSSIMKAECALISPLGSSDTAPNGTAKRKPKSSLLLNGATISFHTCWCGLFVSLCARVLQAWVLIMVIGVLCLYIYNYCIWKRTHTHTVLGALVECVTKIHWAIKIVYIMDVCTLNDFGELIYSHFSC